VRLEIDPRTESAGAPAAADSVCRRIPTSGAAQHQKAADFRQVKSVPAVWLGMSLSRSEAPRVSANVWLHRRRAPSARIVRVSLAPGFRSAGGRSLQYFSRRIRRSWARSSFQGRQPLWGLRSADWPNSRTFLAKRLPLEAARQRRRWTRPPRSVVDVHGCAASTMAAASCKRLARCSILCGVSNVSARSSPETPFKR
jgi:hypothetical protein